MSLDEAGECDVRAEKPECSLVRDIQQELINGIYPATASLLMRQSIYIKDMAAENYPSL